MDTRGKGAATGRAGEMVEKQEVGGEWRGRRASGHGKQTTSGLVEGRRRRKGRGVLSLGSIVKGGVLLLRQSRALSLGWGGGTMTAGQGIGLTTT